MNFLIFILDARNRKPGLERTSVHDGGFNLGFPSFTSIDTPLN